MVVTDISLIGWLFLNYGQVSAGLSIAALLGIAGVSAMIWVIHRRIERKIEYLRDL